MAQKLQSRQKTIDSTWYHFTTFLKDIGKTLDNCKLEELRTIYNDEFSVAPDFGDNRPSIQFEKLIKDLKRSRKIKIDKTNNTLIKISVPFKRSAVDQHINERKKNRIKAKKKNNDPNALPNNYYDVLCSQGNIDTRLTELNHRLQEIFHFISNERQNLHANKHGITVTSDHDVDNDILVEDVTIDQSVTIDITVENESENFVRLFCGVLLMDDPLFEMDEVNNVDIPPEYIFTFSVKCHPELVSNYKNVVALAFEFEEGSIFHILRKIVVKVETDLTRELHASSPYIEPPRATKPTIHTDIIEGMRLSSASSSGLVMTKLKSYEVPNSLRSKVNKGDTDDIREKLKEKLTSKNYADKFSTLLHLEELQMDVEFEIYKMTNATMTLDRDERLLRLKVPGLAEKRPSVLRGDHLFAIPKDSPEKSYKGCVHCVEMEELVLGFDPSLVKSHDILQTKFEIHFTFNRVPVRRQHQAVRQAIPKGLTPILFPEEGTAARARPTPLYSPPLSFLKKEKIGKNSQQRTAVRHIIKGSSRPAPYLVFGPPGTGKTVTIVEAIKQVNEHIEGSTILACAPSNSAADLIAVRLLENEKIANSTLFRMNAKYRGWNTVDKVLQEAECCNYGNDYENIFPSKENIQAYRILVTTLSTAGRLASANFPRNHFTHVFIDEAGQAEEPEAIIAVSNLLNPNNPDGGLLVLAGDPKQLGPVLRSPMARKFGLDKSLLERLMTENPLYARKEEEPHYNPKVMTKLLQNYRSHPAIFKVPNKLFYDNELEAKATRRIREMCQWEELPKKNFPLIFHGVEGDDEREGNSPSFFNTKECDAVLRYVIKLMEGNYSGSDIGVITPYRKQVQKIQEALGRRNYKDIKVGSVEEFQGQERLIIIISTVRSDNEHYLREDKKLGFLNDPKRFNVAITRAQALLIVIGNPIVLSRNKYWKSLIDFCNERGGSKGVRYQNDDDNLRNILSKFDAIKITKSTLCKKWKKKMSTNATLHRVENT